MQSIRLSRSRAALALAAALVLVAACGRQQEGERCDSAAEFGGGDSDCGDGLQCVERSSVNSEICCPISGTPTDPACLSDGSTTSSGAGGSGAGGSGATTGTGGMGGMSAGGMGGAAAGGMGGSAGGMGGAGGGA